jgi:hypothetical protein
MWGFTIVVPGTSAPIVLRSLDGATWSPIELGWVSGLARVDQVRFQPSGTMVLLGIAADGRWTAWTWSDRSAPPPTVPPR